jgi:imidazolonepropionase-like amidohydrolase
VPLAAFVHLGADGAVQRYDAWGSTSRMTTIDDHVVSQGDGAYLVTRAGEAERRVRAERPVFASGYAPMLAQDLLLRAWLARGKPATMTMLPVGEVAIEDRGTETYAASGGRTLALTHVAVRGLTWGREDAWLDASGTLAAVVTRDAEFDHFEAIREDVAWVLRDLAKSAGADGVAWLASAARDANAAPRAKDAITAITGGTLVDGTGRPPVPDAAVVLQGERIVAAGPRASVTIPAGATTIDATGKTILPGLWDMHAHLEQVEQAAVYLALGVTTVRDMGNVPDFIQGIRDAIDSGAGVGPRVLVDGLVDGDGPGSLGIVRIASREAIAPTIDRLKRERCHEVKIYSSILPSLVKPIAAYAHAHGMRVVGHVPVGMTVTEAIDAGFDSISHFHNLVDALLPPAPGGMSGAEHAQRIAAIDVASPEVRRLAAKLVAHHVTIDDTIALDEEMKHTLDDFRVREPGVATLPPELLAMVGGVPAELAAVADAAFTKELAILGELHRRGVVFVAGTDIAVPGHSLHREIELYRQAGFTPMEAIQAATIVPARAMHLDAEVGTVEKGKRADVILVDGDPLADPRAIRKVTLVFARGRPYEPGPLRRLAGFR